MEIQYPYNNIKGFLSTFYDLNELDSLFFGLYGEGVDTLGNDFPREKLAQEIVSFCKHRENLPQLLNAMKQTREDQYLKSFPQFQDPLTSLGLSLKPAEVEVPQYDVEAINLPRVQKQGGYLIDEPPENWMVYELTLQELLTKRLGARISGLAINNAPDEDRFVEREILQVSSQARVTIEYDPGVSSLNGRKILQFISEELPVCQLVIMPLDRFSSAPTFIRQSFEHVFLSHLAQFLQTSNLKGSSVGTTGDTNRIRLTAEFGQNVENVIVNGVPGQSLTTNQTVIGIQGYIRDYLLIISYVSQATTNREEIESQLTLLQTLVDSFKIIKPTNLDSEELRLKVLGDQRYMKFIQLNGSQMIWVQIVSLASQWQELNWHKAEAKKRFNRDLKQIRKAIEVFAIEDEELNLVLEELDEIAKMARSKIKEALNSGELSYLIPPKISGIQDGSPDDLG